MAPNGNKGGSKKIKVAVIDGVLICVRHQSRIYNDTCPSCNPTLGVESCASTRLQRVPPSRPGCGAPCDVIQLVIFRVRATPSSPESEESHKLSKTLGVVDQPSAYVMMLTLTAVATPTRLWSTWCCKPHVRCSCSVLRAVSYTHLTLPTICSV